MNVIPIDDYETPIGELPGYLGHELDQMLFLDWLSPQDEALWSEYIDLLVDEDLERSVRIEPGRWQRRATWQRLAERAVAPVKRWF